MWAIAKKFKNRLCKDPTQPYCEYEKFSRFFFFFFRASVPVTVCSSTGGTVCRPDLLGY